MKRFYLFCFSLVLGLMFVACGSSTSTTSGNSSASTDNTPTTSTTSSTPAATTNTTDTIIHTTSATIKGKTVTLLTNAQGMTLYYFLPDTATTSACTGGCASYWPPYLATSTPQSNSSLPGKLTLLKGANGQQVTYNGHPLYTYIGDKGPGQTNGEGVSNKWFVATSDLATNAGSTSTSGGYGSSGY